MISRFPENAGEVTKEAFQDLLAVISLFSVDHQKNGAGGAESIGPLLHLESAFKLGLSDFEQFVVVLLKSNWIWNVVGLLSLLECQNSLEVLVQKIRNLEVLLLALVFESKVQQFVCR